MRRSGVFGEIGRASTEVPRQALSVRVQQTDKAVGSLVLSEAREVGRG